MRTFSKLKALCAYPEVLAGPAGAAAARGTLLHEWAERWAQLHAIGEPHSTDGLPDLVRGWAERLQRVWTPPDGLECEVALGLADYDEPAYVAVEETPPGSHEYRAIHNVPLLTAGRADWIWPDGAGIRVCDIKTGQFYLGPPAQLRQLLAQGLAATMRAGVPGFVPGVYYARLGVFDWGQAIVHGTDEWEAAWDAVYDAAKLPAEPRPGGWCLGCWEKKACSAYAALEAA